LLILLVILVHECVILIQECAARLINTNIIYFWSK